MVKKAKRAYRKDADNLEYMYNGEKDALRGYFATCMLCGLKMSQYCKVTGIDQGNFSRFMKGSEFNFLLPVEKLRLMQSTIQANIQKIA